MLLHLEKSAEYFAGWLGYSVEAAAAHLATRPAMQGAAYVRKFRTGTPEYAAQWEAEMLGVLPERWSGKINQQFRKRGGGDAPLANIWLRETVGRYRALRVPLSASDADLCELAKKASRECFDAAAGADYTFDMARLIERMREYCGRWGVRGPVVGERVTPAGAVGRMSCELWWRRQLRKVHVRGMEGEAVRLGYVHRRAGLYCSDETLDRRQQQKRRNAATMDSLEFENEFGQHFTMAQLAALSVANPAIRRGELMCRIAGFEAVALSAGHVGEFVTLTCPSEYHARLSGNGEENPKYAGHSPRDGQSYLNGIWAKIRAKLARQGVRLYGFRVAEPHHDACPHWHMLFFMGLGQVEAFRGVVRGYALEACPEEAGAQENRVKFKAIDRARGSAAGYIAKYIAKNVDGVGVGLDLEGNPAIESAMRVDAWASAWGIRQFQQVGGPPVGVWRELRRIGMGATPEMERCRSAADVGNWGAYVLAMGGATCKRVSRPVELARRQVEEKGRYGESGAWVPYGVRCINTGAVAESRRFQWRVIGRVSGGAVLSPWSPVNNCTGGGANGGVHSGVSVLPMASECCMVCPDLPAADKGMPTRGRAGAGFSAPAADGANFQTDGGGGGGG